MAREAERKASFFGTTKQDRSRRTTYYNDRCLVWVQFSSSPGSSALISYPLSVSATSTAGIVRNAASARRKGMGSNNDLPKNPPVKSSKRRSISRRNRSNGSHCCGVAKKIFRIAQALCLRVRHGWCPPNGTRGWPAPALKGQYGERRCQEQYETRA